MQKILLNTNQSNSVIWCGEGAFEANAPKYRDKQIFIVTDSNVYALYRQLLWKTFGDDFPYIILPAGERSKNVRRLTDILNEMLKKGMRRNCYVIAIGGGVIGDIAGLAAALYMRGVHLVQIPTTLLAQVDSSVGGKTAVDHNGVKNVIGTFYQPEEVIVDPLFLQTLPEREVRCGLGEIVKYGALNKEIYNKLLENCDNLFNLSFLAEITSDCIRHKVEVVEADFHDAGGVRKSLNLGHTTGHALELFYRQKSHGEFVLIGAFYELQIAEKYGICGGQYAENLKKLIFSVVKNIPAYADIERAAEYASYDKKNVDEKISLIVPESEGKWTELKLRLTEYVKLLAECRNNLR